MSTIVHSSKFRVPPLCDPTSIKTSIFFCCRCSIFHFLLFIYFPSSIHETRTEPNTRHDTQRPERKYEKISYSWVCLMIEFGFQMKQESKTFFSSSLRQPTWKKKCRWKTSCMLKLFLFRYFNVLFDLISLKKYVTAMMIMWWCVNVKIFCASPVEMY